MQRIFVISLFILCSSISSFGQCNTGTVIHERFVAPSIKGNPAGENPVRRLTIYLPPGYDQHHQRYPVIYFLHGFNGEDSATMEDLEVNKLLDTAISTQHIRPVIFVLPNSYTKYKGSFYTNSVLTGKWGDYIARDVVDYVDRHFRTIPIRPAEAFAALPWAATVL